MAKLKLSFEEIEAQVAAMQEKEAVDAATDSINNGEDVVTDKTPEVIDGAKASQSSSTIVIAAMPCLSKTTYCSKHEDSKDLESSLYSRKQDNTRNEEFPGNYINMLKWHLVNNNWKYIFTACHKVVRDAMKADNIKFYILYPAVERKEEILNLCRERGNSEEFINMLSANWETWIEEIKQEENAYELAAGEFISDELFDTKLKFLKQ